MECHRCYADIPSRLECVGNHLAYHPPLARVLLHRLVEISLWARPFPLTRYQLGVQKQQHHAKLHVNPDFQAKRRSFYRSRLSVRQRFCRGVTAWVRLSGRLCGVKALLRFLPRVTSGLNHVAIWSSQCLIAPCFPQSLVWLTRPS